MKPPPSMNTPRQPPRTGAHSPGHRGARQGRAPGMAAYGPRGADPFPELSDLERQALVWARAFLKLPADEQRAMRWRGRVAGRGSLEAFGLTPRLTSLGAAVHEAAAVTVITNAHGPATKVFSIKSGKLDKQSAARIYEGTAEWQAVVDIDDVDRLLDSLKFNQAITAGLPEAERAKVVTQAKLNGAGNGVIARDRAHFAYRERPGLFPLDHDPATGQAPLTSAEADAIFREVWPEWGDCDRLWRPSASSAIIPPEGIPAAKGGGLHGFALVRDARLIPAIGEELIKRLWLADYGYIMVGEAGQLLVRTIFDASVWQPERLFFEAQPILRDGIKQGKLETAIFRGEHRFFDPAGIGAADDEQFKKMVAAAKNKIKPQAEPKRKIYKEKQKKAAKKRGLEVSPETLDRALDHQILGHDFPIRLADGSSITIGEMLADPERWDGIRIPDPLEPDYGGKDKRIALCRLKQDNPNIYSHAHGGIRYAVEGRREFPLPLADSELTPVMELLDKVLLTNETEPPMRSLTGWPVEVELREPAGLHELTAEGANDDESEQSRLPAPKSRMLTRHNACTLALLIERYVRFHVQVAIKDKGTGKKTGETFKAYKRLPEGFLPYLFRI